MALPIIAGFLLLSFGPRYWRVPPQRAIRGSGVTLAGAFVLLAAGLAMAGLIRPQRIMISHE